MQPNAAIVLNASIILHHHHNTHIHITPCRFVSINPNSKIPCAVDHAPEDGGPAVNLFESGAILLYLVSDMSTVTA